MPTHLNCCVFYRSVVLVSKDQPVLLNTHNLKVILFCSAYSPGATKCFLKKKIYREECFQLKDETFTSTPDHMIRRLPRRCIASLLAASLDSSEHFWLNQETVQPAGRILESRQ